MDTKYKDVGDIVFKLRDHRDHQIRKSVIETLAVLASANPQVFLQEYLSVSIVYLMTTLAQREREKAIGTLILDSS